MKIVKCGWNAYSVDRIYFLLFYEHLGEVMLTDLHQNKIFIRVPYKRKRDQWVTIHKLVGDWRRTI